MSSANALSVGHRSMTSRGHVGESTMSMGTLDTRYSSIAGIRLIPNHVGSISGMATAPDLTTPHGRLRFARKQKKMSVPALSERTGIKIDTVKAHEQRNIFNEDQAKSYARALGRPWLWLLHGIEDQSNVSLTTNRKLPLASSAASASTLPAMVTIREVDVHAGAGGGGEMPAAYVRAKDGSWMPSDAIAAEVMFPESWLVSLGLDPARTDLVRVRGDSMSPEIEDGDWVFVDRRVQRLTADDIYLIFDGWGIVVKSLAIVRAARGDARVRILSANPKYPAEEVPADDVLIIGRVHYRIGRIVRSR